MSQISPGYGTEIPYRPSSYAPASLSSSHCSLGPGEHSIAVPVPYRLPAPIETMDTSSHTAASSSSMGPFSFPAGNDDFRAARDRCARACRAFNDTHEDAAPAERASRWLDIVRPVRGREEDSAPVILDMTFAKAKSRKANIPFVKPPFHADYGLRLRIGGSTFINRYCMILDTPVADIVIGERCKIGPHLCIAAAGHALSPIERAATRNSLGKGVSIGDDVWIGANVTILGGVTIGNGAVIGAGSLVTNDIKPGWSAFGVPARQQRSLVELPPESVSGHFETLQDTLNDGGMVDAFLREQLPRARLSSTSVCEKHDERTLERSVSSPPLPYLKALAFSVIVLLGLCIFLIGVLFGSKRMAFAFGREETADSL